MAKSPRTGENRGRRASDKRQAAESQSAGAPPLQARADDRGGAVELPTGGQGVTKTQIAARAYELYVERGGTHGYDIEDWLQAERELLGRR